MIFIDLLLYSEVHIKDANTLIKKHVSNLGYLNYLTNNNKRFAVQLAGVDEKIQIGGITYDVRRANNKKWTPNFKLFISLRNSKPDIILVHSFIYAWQIVFLRLIIGSKTKIIVQNHAEQPFGYKRRWIQKVAAKCISAFLFVSKEQAEPWIKAGIIKNRELVFEVMEGSTYFQKKENSRSEKLFLTESEISFIWVGRLDENKDPLTVLRAFATYSKNNGNVKLYMIYNEYDLLEEVQNFISKNKLSAFVKLIGFVEHTLLENYYNEADYFILGSHREGSGYALCEAMACGCVPIVTKIPSFEKMLDHGDCGYLFEPGNSNDLYSILSGLNDKDLQKYSGKVLEKFKRDLSFKAIANKIEEISNFLLKK